jgi:hypothetical protein
MKFVTFKVGGPDEAIFGRFPRFHGANNMCTNFYQIHTIKLCTTFTLSYGKKTPPKLGIICERLLAPKFGSYIWAAHGTTSQNKQSQPNKKSYMVGGYEGFICNFGPHGSGHHSTLVDTFHPCRLPPSELQTHKIIRWRPILCHMSAEGLKVKNTHLE